MKKLIALTAFVAFALTASFAQKYGHLNMGNLIAQMPETEAADAELEAYQKQLVAKGEEMAKAFQEDYGQFVAAVQKGDVAPKVQEERGAALQKKQQEILAYEEEIRQKVQTKRQELLQPIFDRAEAAIKVIGDREGYELIFDTSVFNSILFAQESDDVMPLVVAELGLSVGNDDD